MRSSPWGHPGLMPVPCTAALCYNIKSLDHKAPIHLNHYGGDQHHQCRGREGHSRGTKMDYRSLHPPVARDLNGVS